MMRLLLALVTSVAPLLLIPVQPPGEEAEPYRTPDPLVPMADLANVPVPERTHVRYLWLGSLNSRERNRIVSALCGHIPALATESDLAPPVLVGDGLYMRLDAQAQGDLFAKVYERLANFDPYFHVNTVDVITETRITIVQIGGNKVKFRCLLPRDGATVTIDGQRMSDRAGTEREFDSPPIEKESTWTFAVDGISQRIVARPGQQVTVDFREAIGQSIRRRLVPWLEPLAAAVHSDVPLLDGGWFLAHTAIQEGRNDAGYYDFLGIKNRKAFEELIGFSGKLAEGARFTELLEAVADSRVAQQPRRVQREYAIGGGYWRTLDNKLADAERNPLRILDRKLFKYAAEEAIGFKANGWFVSGLFVGNQPLVATEKDGDRQNSAPDFIGYTTAHGLDGRIHAGIGCVACHYYLDAGAAGGLIDFDPWVRDVLRPGADNPFALADPDPDEYRKKRQQYLRPFTGPMESDRQRHSVAVKEATGLKPEEWGKAYVAAFNAYEGPIDLERASRYWGVEPDRIKEAAIAAVRAGNPVDPVIAGLVRGKKVGVRQFEEVFGVGLVLLKGLKP